MINKTNITPPYAQGRYISQVLASCQSNRERVPVSIMYIDSPMNSFQISTRDRWSALLTNGQGPRTFMEELNTKHQCIGIFAFWSPALDALKTKNATLKER